MAGIEGVQVSHLCKAQREFILSHYLGIVKVLCKGSDDDDDDDYDDDYGDYDMN